MGKLLDECLHKAGIDRSVCYVNKAVKHFKFEQRGKRRIHSKSNAGETQRCAWWLGGELELLRPRLIVALGATALYNLMVRSVGLTEERAHILRTANATPPAFDPLFAQTAHRPQRILDSVGGDLEKGSDKFDEITYSQFCTQIGHSLYLLASSPYHHYFDVRRFYTYVILTSMLQKLFMIYFSENGSAMSLFYLAWL